jgi:hypothetical protein
MTDFLLFEAPAAAGDGVSISRSPTPDKTSEALALRDVCAVSRELAFAFTTVKRDCVLKLVSQVNAGSVGELAGILSKVSPRRLEGELSACCDEIVKKSKYGAEERLKPVGFAWSLYFNEVLKKIFTQPEAARRIAGSQKPAKGYVKFAARLHGWQVVKKANLDRASDGEALACLAGVSAAANRKSVEWLLGSNFYALEALVSDALKNSRKSFSKIPVALAAFPAVEKQLAALCEPEHLKIVGEYYVRAVFEGFGYPAQITPAQVGEVWPELKAPAMRGRKPKGSKG